VDGIAEMAAGTRVHGGDEGEARRIGEGGSGAGEGDDPVLQGLAQRLQGIAAEFGQLIETGEARLGGEADSAGGRAPGDAVVERRLTSPRPGMLPPMRPASEIEWWGARKGRRERMAWSGGRRPAME
jgi:hypothetical protein